MKKFLLFSLVAAASFSLAGTASAQTGVIESAAADSAPTAALAEALAETGTLTPPGRRDPLEVTPARDAMYQGMVFAQDGQHELAIPKLEWAIEQDPTLIGAWETLGWSYWLTDRRDDAANLWRRLVVIAPNEPMGYNLLAQVATREGKFDDARNYYETSLRLNPDQYETRLNLARVLLWSGKHMAAKTMLQKLFEEDPARVDVEIELAWTMYINEEYEDVIVHWNNIIEAIPDSAPFLLARANVLVLIGSLDEAAVDARRILELDPRNAGALELLTVLAMQKQDPETAVATMRQSMDLMDDDSMKAKMALNIAAYMKGQLDKESSLYSRQDILAVVRDSLDLDDRAVGAHLFLGEMLIMDKQFEAAERVFQHVLDEFNPQNERARTGLLETYFGRAQYDKVEQQLRVHYSQLNSNNPLRYIYWARLYFARGNLTAALDVLDRLEYEGSQGAVFTLLYHGLSPSEFSNMPSVRQLREQLMALRRDGFRFITPSELEVYFSQKKPASLTGDRPWLNRSVRSVKYAWTGEKPADDIALSDYTPDKVVMVTFDDGLRNSFRYGGQVAEDLGIRMTMFVGVGDVLSPDQRYVASFPEIRAYHDSGNWEVHSHLWDAGQLLPVTEEGRTGLPLANQLWLAERNRQESLREYQNRVRREFRESQTVIARELGLEKQDIMAVAYPYGEIGQENDTNIRAFRVPEVILNESEITYKMGFLQSPSGYTMKTDDPMLYKRWEPDRTASARDVLRQAYRQHPVFTARRMRAEIAALSGRLHLANENLALLRRDGYPEEELKELEEYVNRSVGRLAALPEGAEDITGRDTGDEPWLSLRKPHLGAEGQITRANEMIDDRDYGLYAGLMLNRRLGLQVRAGAGEIRQVVRTNQLVEAVQTTTTSSSSTEQRIENGEVSNVQVNSTTTSSRTILSNRVTRTEYRADKTYFGGTLSYTHDSGSFTLANAGLQTLEGDEFDEGGEEEPVFGLEHQWRPAPAIDMSARYARGLVPSAREMITYDSFGIRPYWRIRDGWHANGIGYFAYYDDQNSYLKAEIENYWVLSHRHDIWWGIRNSIDTVDRDSDLYWTPFWDQRHVLLLRLRRSFPDYYGQLRVHFGYQKTEPRREELDEYEVARVQGEEQGYSPGLGPDDDWEKMMGFAASVTRKFKNGFEFTGEVTVNAADDYTEHTALVRLQYNF